MRDARYKVLLIEDDQLDQMAFTRFVRNEELGYDCRIAGSLSEARALLAAERFDVIIADYSLGDGTAIEILESVRNVPVILITGAGDEEVAVKAWKAGAYDYLIKDIERNYLKTVPITVENAIKYRKTKEQAQLLSGAVMSTDDSVFITDMEDRIVFVNRAFCQTYGYVEEEIIGQSSLILFGVSDRDADNMYRTNEGASGGAYHVRKDGSEFPVSLSLSPIKDEVGNETALVGVARDISEQVMAQDKIRTINLKLKQGSRLIG
ncbi:MAG: PAS domain-containing protein [Planctomycetota bacterium]|jgi:PAS domain S-box-containing protein